MNYPFEKGVPFVAIVPQGYGFGTLFSECVIKDISFFYCHPEHMMGHRLPGSIVWVVLICLALVSASHFVNKGCQVNF